MLMKSYFVSRNYPMFIFHHSSRYGRTSIHWLEKTKESSNMKDELQHFKDLSDREKNKDN